MISKDRAERGGLASCEALLGLMIGRAEDNHEILQLIQTESEPKFETQPNQIQRAVSALPEVNVPGRQAAR